LFIYTQIILNVVLSENAAFLGFQESGISPNKIFQFSIIEGKATCLTLAKNTKVSFGYIHTE
jgi:hypothetical protein